MRRGYFFVLFLLIFSGMGLLRSPRAYAHSYGPACQWIHLVGQVRMPQDVAVARPIQLTVSYQLPDMKHPATLLTNFPLPKDQFKFFFAGFDQELPGAILVRPMFFFAKEIWFRYFAKSADGKWRSDFYESKYVPELIPTVDLPMHRDKQFLCHTRVELDPIVIKPKR